MITIKKLECFEKSAVELIDIDGGIYQGWFIKDGNKYELYPFNNFTAIYIFKASHIKSIKHLTNGYEIRR